MPNYPIPMTNYPSLTEAQMAGRPMIIGPVALLILIIALIFSFPYLVSEEWPVGVLIAAVGIGIIAVILYFGERRELQFRRQYDAGSMFGRNSKLMGFMALIAGILMIIIGGPLTSVAIISVYILLLGVAFILAGIIWIIVGLRG